MPTPQDKKRVPRKRPTAPKAKSWLDVIAILASNTHIDAARCLQILCRCIVILSLGQTSAALIDEHVRLLKAGQVHNLTLDTLGSESRSTRLAGVAAMHPPLRADE